MEQQDDKWNRENIKEKQDEKIDAAIYEHRPLDILNATQQDFLAGYKIQCVDDLGVPYIVQCLRQPDELLYEVTMNNLTIRLDVNKVVTCYEGLVFKARALKRRYDPTVDSII